MDKNQHNNKISISPPDHEVHEHVLELLEELHLQDIHFSVNRGVVILQGEAGDLETIEKIDDRIKRVPGVQDVQNDLVLQSHH